jgi:dipeptide/tripeptide permease
MRLPCWDLPPTTNASSELENYLDENFSPVIDSLRVYLSEFIQRTIVYYQFVGLEIQSSVKQALDLLTVIILHVQFHVATTLWLASNPARL